MGADRSDFQRLGHVPDANGVCVLCLDCCDPACCEPSPCMGDEADLPDGTLLYAVLSGRCDPDCSRSGVDQTDVSDPAKVWRCDGCGAEGTSAALDAAHIPGLAAQSPATPSQTPVRPVGAGEAEIEAEEETH